MEKKVCDFSVSHTEIVTGDRKQKEHVIGWIFKTWKCLLLFLSSKAGPYTANEWLYCS